MALVVSFTNDDFPDGTEFDIGLGAAVPNKRSVTMTRELEEGFVARHGVGVKEYYADNKAVKVTGTSDLSKANAEGGDD